METIKDLVNTRKGESALIIGAGAAIKEEADNIDAFIKRKKPFTLGINNMTSFWVPDYHVWTNTQRFRTYGESINPNSHLLLGQNIPLKVIRNVIGGRDYILINYTDMKEGVPLGYKDGKIYGYFRTAGNLAIMIAHLMGASEVNIVGADGYSLHKREDLVKGQESHHCYGNGFTDTADWETCVKKDKIINNVLNNLREYGIDFKILTPTKYEDFYKKVW